MKIAVEPDLRDWQANDRWEDADVDGGEEHGSGLLEAVLLRVVGYGFGLVDSDVVDEFPVELFFFSLFKRVLCD